MLRLTAPLLCIIKGFVELCVVGAGFAGLACARAAAARGLRVRVLERKPDPGAACRTTGLLVQEAAEELEPPARLVRRIPGVRLYAPSLRVLDLESPGYWFLATDTPALLRRMAEGIDIVRGEYRGGFPFGARFLVGADGPRSRVAREFGLGVNLEFLVGVEAEFEGVRDRKSVV